MTLLPYWVNPSFLIFEIWALWRSGLSDKKAVLSQRNRAMPQLFFSV